MKKNNAIFVLLLYLLLILGLSVSAQETKSSKVISYHGESENWLGSFTIEYTKEEVMEQGKIKYKPEDVGSVGQVTCIFETITGKTTSISQLAGISIDSPIGEKGTLSSKSVAGNINFNSKMDVVNVTVKWDGKTESFTLYKE
ncbi:MAG: hypothetical protein RR595_11495 [Lysinibacillus sp.]